MSKMKYFIGKMPPPFGGVTVFNQRKYEQLVNENEIDAISLIEPRFSNIIKIIICLRSKGVKHISASNFILITLCCFFARNNTVIFYDHNSSRHFFEMHLLKKNIISIFLNKCHKIVLVDEHLKENYRILKNFEKIKDKFLSLSAFLPPSISEKELIVSGYKEEVLNLYTDLSGKKSRKIVLTSASKPNLDNKGRDIYSLDLLIDIFHNLSKIHKEYIFIIAISEYQQTEYSKYIQNKVSMLKGIYENLIFLEDNTQIWPLFNVSYLVVRATTTDGDSVTVKEALHFGSNVLASNVVPRPNGVILFELEKDSLQEVIENIL